MWTSGHKFNSELKCVLFIVIDTEIPLRESDDVCSSAVSYHTVMTHLRVWSHVS